MKPINAQTMPRREPMIQGAIETLQAADDEIRAGQDPSITLVAAKAVVDTLLEKYAGKRSR